MVSNNQGETAIPYKLIDNLSIEDRLGKILVYNDFSDFPFIPRRFFTVTNLEANTVRGAHAHKSCEQVLFAICGTIELQIDDGKAIHKILMDSSSQAVYKQLVRMNPSGFCVWLFHHQFAVQ